MNTNPIQIKESERYWENSQSENMAKAIKQYGLKIKNDIKIEKTILSNTIIIEYTIKYVEIKQQRDGYIADINQI